MHIGFTTADLPQSSAITTALLSGDPGRSELIAKQYCQEAKLLSDQRGLKSFYCKTPKGIPLIVATSGMGAPSTSIVVNELYHLGVTRIVRVGTTGAIQSSIALGCHCDSGRLV
jgi:uridine phosphorylase